MGDVVVGSVPEVSNDLSVISSVPDSTGNAALTVVGGFSPLNSIPESHLVHHRVSIRKRKIGSAEPDNVKVFKDSCSSVGGIVKAKGEVLRVRSKSGGRGPNVICKVEKFRKLCASFDSRRRGWVYEMGFGGLLSIGDMKLPRCLCYWLMTMIDPKTECLVVGNTSFRFSCNQVSWVLGLPMGELAVPCDFDNVVSLSRLIEIEEKYGQVRNSVDRVSGKEYSRIEFAVTPAILNRLMSEFGEEDVDEFKMLFLMASLDMVLCPTQSSRFPKELMPALLCASKARMYNWCALVLCKLMDSVKRFGERFYSDGFSPGCGGCSLFVAIFYLDRLKRNAPEWGRSPRIKYWSNAEIQKACGEDRCDVDGDFGALGVFDLAYGENHPNDARDLPCSIAESSD